ncbi:hypothetical protein TIFTF001_021101 [Ficus carica]|uniref:Uncharacterized protein n=1 Tax=Ficus carica TaxID=3494 RepID=A0AA88DBK8_FICCA|nr:hypothetical protein TIFTF001_021101 [Ficus carica]
MAGQDFLFLFLFVSALMVREMKHLIAEWKDDVDNDGNLKRRRYLATPWLSSPHIQTVFLNFFGRPPVFSYKRKIFHTSDGGTIALDWLTKFDVVDGGFHMNNVISRDDTTPIMVVIPGLTSDSESAHETMTVGLNKIGHHFIFEACWVPKVSC